MRLFKPVCYAILKANTLGKGISSPFRLYSSLPVRFGLLKFNSTNLLTLSARKPWNHFKEIRWSSSIPANHLPTSNQTLAADSTKADSQPPSQPTPEPSSIDPGVSEFDVKKVLEQPENEIDLSGFLVPETPKYNELVNVNPPSYQDFNFMIISPRAWISEGLIFMENYMPSSVAIITATFLVRLLFFPLIVKSRRNQVELSRVSPQVNELLKRKSDATAAGDDLEAMKLNQKLVNLYKGNKALSLKSIFLYPLVSMVFFTCFFLTIRKMAVMGHEPFKTGGFLSFIDLHNSDTSWYIPLLVSGTLFAQIKIGTEFGLGAPIPGMGAQLPGAKYLTKILQYGAPVVSLFYGCKVPSAVGVYWVTNNAISVFQSLVILIPWVSRRLKIPPKSKVVTDPPQLKNIIKDAKVWIKNYQEKRQLKKQSKEIERKFDQAGTGPIRKTFDYDPTKIRRKE